MSEVSQSAKKLISSYQFWYKSLQSKEGGGLIHIDEVVSKVATFYEKMRGVIDWREEHLLRKTAIERILKRRIFLKRSGKEISEPFINELIRGGHFPNDAIPESKITEIQKSIDKYIYILDNAPAHNLKKMRSQLYDWLLGIAACEMEEILSPSIKETAIMDFMLEQMKEKIEITGNSLVSKIIPEDEKNTQIYIAVQEALFKLDPPLIHHNLLKKIYPDWTDLPQEKLQELAQNIYSAWERLEKDLNHPLAEKFYAICERYDTAYLLLSDVISKEPLEILNTLKNPDIFESKIKAAYKERLKKNKGRLKRAAFYSTLSIFLSKILIAFAIEVPFDKYFSHGLSYSNLGLNVIVPPILMAFLVLSIRPQSKQNEQLAVMEVMKITYERERKDTYEVRPSRKRGFVLNSVIALIYLLSFAGSFGLIFWELRRLDFSIISIVIFLIFISLISFTGVKIRQRAKELKVEKDEESFFNIFIDLFSLPIIQVGRWLSNQWVKYNAIVILFNSLLDMPFQVFVEFLEQWRSFLKEKKEEIH
ncbi:MAG: hypothetical protein HYT20_02210 [Candidatus Nealsonbacteria bacterium]|nr:hypothetical protein [Candidatus Nealsonbacteria bacterium]